MRKDTQKILWRFMLAGVLVPCLLFAVLSISNVMLGASLTWFLIIPWPTILLLMWAEAGGGLAGELFAFLISALANVLVYALVGLAVSFVYRRFFSPTE